MARIQAKRKIAINTPLGDDKLLLTGLRVREQLGRLTEIHAVMLSEDPELDFSGIVGKNVTLRMELDDSTERYWNGFVSHFSQQGASGHLPLYTATIVPWLWFLTRNADYRIFQQMTVPDIIKQVFRDRGFTDFSESLSGSYTPWEYCVQYRETDFNFISRLMEQEGIYYFFKHENGKHELVLADSPVAHSPYPGYDTIKYRSKVGGPTKEQEYVFSWMLDQRVQPEAYETTDYDFKLPRKMLKSTARSPVTHAPGPLELFDYPGEYIERADGDQTSRTRLEELQAQFETIHGESNCRALAGGFLFTLEDHPRADQNREYLVTSATIEMAADDFSTGNGDGGAAGTGEVYSCRFTAIDSKTPFRAARLTPKPHIQGPQTAMVVGPSGEEIHTDEHGRIKVHFHWDRHNPPDEKASCWIRVSQPWAGKGWGGVSIPRIGQEVIVEFLEGDPDQPIVTGRVYNGDNKPPYPLPGGAVFSGVKTKTHKGSGFNEMSMDDTAGKEKINIHGQYDMSTTVLHNQTLDVKNDRSITVIGKLTEKITSDTSITILTGKYSHAVNTGVASYYVKADLTEKYDAKQTTTVGQAIAISSTNADIALTAKTKITLTCGSSSLSMAADGTIELKGVKITIKGSTSVGVDGDKITITAGSEAKMGVSSQNVTCDKSKVGVAGASINSSAVGMHEIAGAVVKIN